MSPTSLSSFANASFDDVDESFVDVRTSSSSALSCSSSICRRRRRLCASLYSASPISSSSARGFLPALGSSAFSPDTSGWNVHSGSEVVGGFSDASYAAVRVSYSRW